MNIEDVAARGGMTRKGERWGPCPDCKAEKGGSNDSRPPVKLTESAESGPLQGGPAWYCVKCKQGGGMRSLAELLDVDLGAEALALASPEPAPKPTPARGKVDVPAAWASLREQVSADGQRAAVDWLARVRRWPKGLAERVARADGLVMVERRVQKRDDGPAGQVARMSPDGYGALIPLYDEDGVVRSVVRRWTRADPPKPGWSKTLQLSGKVRGQVGPLFLGSVPRAAAVLRQGGTVWLVEGDVDWLAADAMAAIGGGCALAGPGEGQLGKLARALIKAARAAHVEPGRGLVLAVGDPDRVGREAMEDAGTKLLDVARVRLSDGLQAYVRDAETGEMQARRVDISDALASGRSAAAVIAEAESGKALVEVGQTDGYEMTLRELRQHLYRWPLRYAYEAAHWSVNVKAAEKQDKTGGSGALPVHRRATVQPTAELLDLVVDWFLAHGGVFTRDEHGTPWLYFDKALHDLSSKPWGGRLYRLGRIPTAKGEGAAIFEGIQEWAFGEPIRPMRPWSFAHLLEDGSPEIRLHLHDDEDRVVAAGPGGLRVERNGASDVIHRPTPGKVQPMCFVPGVDAHTTSSLLRQRIGRWLTLPPLLRLLSVAFDLLTPARHLRRYIPMRPIKWCLGPAGNGKTEALKLSTALWYGKARLLAEPTPAALFSRASVDPYLAVDNPETENRSTGLLAFWLHGANEGVERIKRRRDTDTETVDEAVECIQAVTTVEPPSKAELVTRCLIFGHSLDYADPAYTRHDPLTELAADRDVIVSGILALWAERILPRLQRGDGTAYAELIPAGAAIGRQRVTLGTIAVIADELCVADKSWGFTGREAIEGWRDYLEEQAQGVMISTDPISAGLEGLRFALDAVRRFGEEPVQGWDYDERFKVEPLFRCWDGERWVPTKDANKGENVQKWGKRFPVVVGFSGAYEDVFRDVTLAAKDAGDRNWNAHIPNLGVLRGRWAHVKGWSRENATPQRRGRNGPRLYDVVRTDMMDGVAPTPAPPVDWHGTGQ